MTDWDLLQEYAQRRSEPAFAELVGRHLDLVYSAALRQVRSPELAEEVAQSVFTDLARTAGGLKPDSILPAWLHQVTRRTAIDVVRRESRRQARERFAAEMTEMNSTPPDWASIEPLLDEAIQDLETEDRIAILLRYFDDKSLREVGETLGASEDAAQKRVSRAVEKLRQFFSKKGVTVGAGSLVAVLSTHAVQSAPVGLGAAISSAAVLSGTAIASTATTVEFTKAITMTLLQKTIVVAVIATAVGTTLYEARRAAQLQAQVLAAREPGVSPADSDQLGQLRQERDRTASDLELARRENEQLHRDTAELLRLRGETARLRNQLQELAQAKSTNATGQIDPTQAEMTSWLGRVTQLKASFERKPDQKIPEFQLVTEQDWLNAAKTKLDSDADYRAAMATLRSAAQRKFADLARPALSAYMEANGGQFPTDLAQLQPYLKPPVDEAMLQRYTILSAAEVHNVKVGGEWIITQKAAVDEDYDSRIVIGPNGFGSTEYNSGSVMEELAPAMKAYAAANNGREPNEPSQLAPYLTTAAEQAALQRVIEKFTQKAAR